jgi:hypothetical protein
MPRGFPQHKGIISGLWINVKIVQQNIGERMWKVLCFYWFLWPFSRKIGNFFPFILFSGLNNREMKIFVFPLLFRTAYNGKVRD